MPLPTTGPISFGDVREELGRSSGPISLGDADVRALAGVSSGAISMNDLRGKGSYQYQGTMTVGNFSVKGSGTFGYDGIILKFGSLTPTDIPGRGTIGQITQATGTRNVVLTISGSHSNFFNRIIIGNLTLYSSQAQRTVHPDGLGSITSPLTVWEWPDTTPYLTERNGQTLTVQII